MGVTTGNEGSTYAVVAIEKADGTPMPSSTDEDYGKTPFFISPLIKGLEPWNYNIASMNGSYGEQVINLIPQKQTRERQKRICNNSESSACTEAAKILMHDRIKILPNLS